LQFNKKSEEKEAKTIAEIKNKLNEITNILKYYNKKRQYNCIRKIKNKIKNLKSA